MMISGGSLFAPSLAAMLKGWGFLMIALGLYIALTRNPAPKSRAQQLQEQYRMLRKEMEGQMISSVPPVIRKLMRDAHAQSEQMEAQSRKLASAIRQAFSGSQITEDKFFSTAESVERLYFENARRMIARAGALPPDAPAESVQRAAANLESLLADNAQILERMERLILALNQLESRQTPLEDSPAMAELQELTEQVRLYEQH